MDELTFEGIDAAIKSVRADESISDEKKGEALLGLYKQKVALEKSAAPQPANRAPAHDGFAFEDGKPINAPGESAQVAPAAGEIAGDEVRTEMVNAWGGKFTDNAGAIAAVAEDAFDTPELAQAFLRNSNLDTTTQIQTLHGLAELIAMPIVPSELPSEALGDAMQENFARFSGSNHEQNLKDATRAAQRIFGGWDKADSFFIKHNWDRNPQVWTRAMIWLSQVGRGMKK